MQPEPGKIHVVRAPSAIEHGKDVLDLGSHIRTDASGVAQLKEPLQPLVLEIANHETKLPLTSIACQSSRLVSCPEANNRRRLDEEPLAASLLRVPISTGQRHKLRRAGRLHGGIAYVAYDPIRRLDLSVRYDDA
jgi:hypothetical protein